MRHRGFHGILLLLVLGGLSPTAAADRGGGPVDIGQAGAAGAPRGAVEQELIQLERAWDEAFLSNNTAFVDRVLASEFIGTYADGMRGDRQQELANVAAFNQQIDSSTLDEFTVQVHGDTAVVWFRRTLVGPSKGQTLTIAHRYLDVFVRRDGRWQCVATQSVRLPN